MSAIVLFHTGTPIPEHLVDCVSKIRQYSKLPIHLLTDSSNLNLDVIVHDVNKFDDLKWLQNIRYFSNDSMKEMWRGSCFRLLYIERLLQDLNLKCVLHFDNDVMLFEKPEVIIDKFDSLYTKFAITAHNSDEVVAGMCYIKSAASLVDVNSFITKELKSDPAILHFKYGGFPNEMRLLSKSGCCDFIPILPSAVTKDVRYSQHFDVLNSVFDPSSYGQYIGGTFSEKKPGWFGAHQEIGNHLSKNHIKVVYENNVPYVIVEESKTKICNLHIHSKQTRQFL